MSNSNNNSNTYCTQNQLLLNNLLSFFNKNGNLKKILPIINGESNLSIRVIDWFVTNYAKKNHTVYDCKTSTGTNKRFKVYIDYKLKLKAYSKHRFDPFCRWERINIPCDDYYIQTTIGQLNFFKWAIENKILDYIEENIELIEKDMNSRNSTSKNKKSLLNDTSKKTRKKREELSISAIKSIKKENVEITVRFD